MSDLAHKTPCIGLCSTVYGDTVCRGCKRFDYEIIDWNGYTMAQKQAIWQRLQQLLEQVMQTKLVIRDKQRLKQKLIQHNIRFHPEQSSYYWTYQLLAKGARHINNIQAYGIELLPTSKLQSLWQLRECIDIEFFELSLQHYPKPT